MSKIIRRLGIGAKASSGRNSCPDFFELENGDFAIIGKDMTDELKGNLPDDAGCNHDERIIVVPRVIITSAKQDIP